MTPFQFGQTFLDKLDKKNKMGDDPLPFFELFIYSTVIHFRIMDKCWIMDKCLNNG